jgi:hypothetical protein
MSAVQIQGNASGTGTLTIAAPNTNTNQTLTLPDQTGTLLTGAGAIAVNASTPTSSLNLDASGNVGIGTSSPGAKLDVSSTTDGDTIRVSFPTAATGTTGGGIQFRAYTNSAVLVEQSRIQSICTDGSASYGAALRFMTAGSGSLTERMRIDSSGNLLVGISSVQSGIASDPVGISLYGSSGLGVGVFVRNSANAVVYVNNKAASGTLITFYCNNTGVGNITSNGSTTTYGTSSDYRLKEDVQPMTGALAKVAALKPVTYTWKNTGERDEGFIAHELQEVCPSAVFGEKDAVNEDGSIKPQNIDTSFLVATLTAAIQEQQALITQLQADVAALKGA